ncbi:hypothetical protein Tco_1382321 [Tanacetum coccineum]
MVSIPIHQDTSLVPPMTTPAIDLTMMQSDSPLPISTATTSIITTTTTIPPNPQPQQSTTDSIFVRRIGELEQHMADLLQDNLALGERLDKHGTQLYNLENLDIPHKKSLELDYLNQRLADQEEAHKKRRKRRDTPRSPPGSPPSQPPPPPPLAGKSGALASAQQSMAWTTSDTRYELTGIAWAQEQSPSDDLMHDDSAPDEQVHVYDNQDSGNDHTPAVIDSRKDWWKPLPEEERPATPKPAWTILPSNLLDVENN